jgi:hypothetical protein
VTELDIPSAGTARVHVLHEGYVGLDGRVSDAAALKASRELLLHVATVIVPGHGAPFGIGARA